MRTWFAISLTISENTSIMKPQTSQLSRNMLGGNSLTIGVFNIAHGEVKKTLTTLNYLRKARKIINFPVISTTAIF